MGTNSVSLFDFQTTMLELVYDVFKLLECAFSAKIVNLVFLFSLKELSTTLPGKLLITTLLPWDQVDRTMGKPDSRNMVKIEYKYIVFHQHR